jgi:hypothetical protein
MEVNCRSRDTSTRDRVMRATVDVLVVRDSSGFARSSSSFILMVLHLGDRELGVRSGRRCMGLALKVRSSYDHASDAGEQKKEREANRRVVENFRTSSPTEVCVRSRDSLLTSTFEPSTRCVESRGREEGEGCLRNTAKLRGGES